MTTSTTATRVATSGRAPMAVAVGMWLVLWQVVAWWVGKDFVLASPVAVAARLVELVPTGAFWNAIGTTLSRVAVGCALAWTVATFTAAAAFRFRWAAALVAPWVAATRAVPVVAIIVVVLLWIDSRWLAAATAALVVYPIVHTQLLAGLASRDTRLLEVARVFAVTRWRRLWDITAPALRPFMITAATTGIGLAWKAGVAAEVIGVARGSVGGSLYDAKLTLAAADVFAWIVVVVALSVVTQRLVTAGLARVPRQRKASAP